MGLLARSKVPWHFTFVSLLFSTSLVFVHFPRSLPSQLHNCTSTTHSFHTSTIPTTSRHRAMRLTSSPLLPLALLLGLASAIPVPMPEAAAGIPAACRFKNAKCTWPFGYEEAR
ncbi:hypothetical protein BCR34DRAFT_567332 [Clohesyomyces aquaticus]|uniref:Uncharacterized protein n=1 Tax=Clohesyomyces aquaticus TaxID=1231657 RepID=A0A1Y1ZIR0_9PLEO|nr:hypothetical protein BCR34DRAFT_567332 [Clohesyomyces aquaticus]